MQRISPLLALPQFMDQISGKKYAETGRLQVKLVSEFVSEIPVFEFYNHAEEGDEQVTYAAMHEAALQKEKQA